MLTQEDDVEIYALAKRRWSISAIARHTGRDRKTVRRYLAGQGGKRVLLVNSTNLCAKTNRATAKFSAQNGKAITLRPKMQSSCGKHPRKHKRHKKKGNGRKH